MLQRYKNKCGELEKKVTVVKKQYKEKLAELMNAIRKAD